MYCPLCIWYETARKGGKGMQGGGGGSTRGEEGEGELSEAQFWSVVV